MNQIQVTQDLPTPLLKATDIAEMLNISRAFAYRLMKQGDIPTVQIGRAVRVRPSDLHSYILQNVSSFVSVDE